MRKVIVLEFITLDGVIQGPGGPDEDTSGGFKYGGWLGPFFDEESGEEMNKQMSLPFDLLLGRKTYEIWKDYWPKHKEEWPESDKATKYVVCHEDHDGFDWEKTVILKGVQEVKELKKSKGPDLHVYGSAKLAQSLLKEDLVDELWLKFFPVTIGKGKRLFEEGTIPAAFKLIDSKITPSGVIFASYKRNGELKTSSVG